MTTSILKRTILFCSFISAGFMAEAQFTYSPTIGAGITAAVLSAPPPQQGGGVSGNVKANSNTNVNLNLGVQVAYQFSDFWTVGSGVFYQYIQPIFHQNSPGITTTVTDKLTYINIPLEIVHTNDQLKKGWYYGIGINFGLPVSGKHEVVGTSDINTTIKFDGERYANDAYTHYNFLNLSGTAKVGYFFGKMFIGANANIGLSNISPDYSTNYKISAYGLQLGYILNRKVVKPAAEVPETPTTNP